MTQKEKAAPSFAAAPEVFTPDLPSANLRQKSESRKDFDEKDADIKNLLGEYRESQEESAWVSAADLLAMPDTKLPTLYDPILPQVGVVVFGGESDAGKSMFLRNLAIHVATGRNFLGYPFGGRFRSVLYASGEDDKTATNYLLKRHNLFYRDASESWRGLQFVFESENLIERLADRLSTTPADLIIIDSFAEFFSGKDMNNSAQVRAFVKPFNELARKNQCCVVFLHHIGKGQENNTPTKNALVGSQSLEAIARACFLFLKDKSDPDIRHLCCVKGNYLGSDFKSESIELRMNTDSFTFTATGNRVPFELLSEAGGKTGDCRRELFEEIMGDKILRYTDIVSQIVSKCKVTDRTAKSWIKIATDTDKILLKNGKDYKLVKW